MTQEEAWLLKEKYNGAETADFLADCERLAAGEPLAYVIGWVPFLDSKIWLDSHPLIPRPETEFWVEKAIAELSRTVLRPARGPSSGPARVLDLCAGSGAIGIAVAKDIPNADITFAELDESHLTTIAKNCEENGVTNPSIVASDLFENVTDTFDLILSNPPYIDPAIDRTEASVKDHEPHLALYGGRGGLELIERIIADTPAHLNHCGQLWLEHEPEQSTAIKVLASRAGFTVSPHVDQYGTERYSILSLS